MNDRNIYNLTKQLLHDVSNIEKCYKYINELKTDCPIFRSLIETFQTYKESNIPLDESGFKLKIKELSETGKEEKKIIDDFFKDYNSDKACGFLTDNNLYNYLLTVLEEDFQDKYNFAPDHNKKRKITKTYFDVLSELEIIFSHKPIVSNLSYFENGLFEKSLLEIQEKGNIKTGFTKLDNNLNGLFPGLYIIGAMPSIGKSTLALQICDNIAQTQNNVLFFSLEQTRLELITKSLTRLIADYEKQNETKDFFERVKTKSEPSGIPSAIELRTNKKWNENERTQRAIENYKNTIANYFTIDDNNFTADINYIKSIVKQYTAETLQKPVIVIDYLQVLQDPIKHTEIRAGIDYNLQELKKIAIDYNTPVLVISSFNRNNYYGESAFDSFKESGGIEYTADVLIALELTRENKSKSKDDKKSKLTVNEINELRKKPERKIKLKCLKNRNGNTFDIDLLYYPRYETFKEEE